jgi:hypothetical protein
VRKVVELDQTGSPDWQNLPMPSCLVKLHEDWKRILPAAS